MTHTFRGPRRRPLPLLTAAAALLIAAALPAQEAPVSTVLVDFGVPDDTTALAEGAAWTNVYLADRTRVNVRDVTGAPTGATAEARDFVADTTGPQVLEALDSLPEQLRVPSAVRDNFAAAGTGRVTFRGLAADRSYRFVIFGSAEDDAGDDPASDYALQGANLRRGRVNTADYVSSDIVGGPNVREVYASDYVRPGASGAITLTVTSARESETAYLNALVVYEYVDAPACFAAAPYKVTVLGSSVARGQGAPGDLGWANQYARLLTAGPGGGDADYASPHPWDFVNNSVGGDATGDALDRYASDLLDECGSYVVYGLSLANEGIRNGGQVAYDRFRENLRQLAERAEADGIQPVVASNYARGDYDAEDYAFVKAINLEIAQWDYPSINLLGALDDGSGRWPAGFAADNGHPNAAGHAEMYAAVVPSLLDALAAGKPAPLRGEASGTGYAVGTGDRGVAFEPAGDARSFTLSFTATVEGLVHTYATVLGEGITVALESDDDDLYLHAGGDTLFTDPRPRDGEPHTYTITYYHATGALSLYVDGEAAAGQIAVDVAPERVTIGESLSDRFGNTGDDSLTPYGYFVRDLFFYRAGMNPDEVRLLATDTVMLTASLEVYAPLTDAADGGAFANAAQSLTEVREEILTSARAPRSVTALPLSPNPTGATLSLGGADLDGGVPLRIHAATGALVRELPRGATGEVDVSTLPPGLYAVSARRADGQPTVGRFVKQ